MADTSIQWAQKVWNPTTGCDRVSPGCDHCYALTMAKRLKGMGSAKYQRDGDPKTSGPGFALTVHPDAVHQPLRWRKPQRIFVNSMSDLFHDKVPTPWLADVFAVMATASHHTYQLLTKRHARMRSVLNDPAFQDQVLSRAIGKGMDPAVRQWPLSSVWLGVSVEDQQWADIRIPALYDTPAAVRFLSCEPLLGPADLRAWTGYNDPGDDGAYVACEPQDQGINWCIVGGESGPGARPMREHWARDLVEQCQTAGIPVFVKQMGSVWARGLADHKGGDPADWPEDLRVRQYPTTASAVTR